MQMASLVADCTAPAAATLSKRRSGPSAATLGSQTRWRSASVFWVWVSGKGTSTSPGSEAIPLPLPPERAALPRRGCGEARETLQDYCSAWR